MRLAAAVVSTCVMVAGLAAPTAARVAAVPFTPPPIRWGTCADPNLRQAGATCGDLVVPLDYAHPDGAKITLAVSRVLHTSPDAAYQGVMLANPGGPGGSGLILSVLGRFVPNDAGDTYDWIGFDPRGVGASRPSLSLRSRTTSSSTGRTTCPRTPPPERVWLARSRALRRACAKAPGTALLAHSRTTDTVARHGQPARGARRRQQINFYGFSYGTYLGQVYATLHPDRVRRFVLGRQRRPAPRLVPEPTSTRTVAFDQNIEIYFRWLAQLRRGLPPRHTGAGRRASLYYQQLNRLDRHPRRRGPRSGRADRRVHVAPATTVYELGGHRRGVLRRCVQQRRLAGLVRLLPQRQPDGRAPTTGTRCTSPPSAPTPRGRRAGPGGGATTGRLYRKAPVPDVGQRLVQRALHALARGGGSPGARHGRAVSQPVLLIDETKDAATPFPGSLEVRGLFPSSSLIAGSGVRRTRHRCPGSPAWTTRSPRT